ncbi:13434_t:CDS:2 [Gigaspora margarita]|uniref:13434_t:CDS:1 n=1 Tax=Gigaspora margarita TaxID=4874 RepID=A0ABN7UQ21_GIGMA|nr:13434_t:CDS:2 [Gigaspora margarita]
MSIIEETQGIQGTPIEISSKTTTSQQESGNIVDWNCLRTADLKVMCFRCGFWAKGLKATRNRKGKSTDQKFSDNKLEEKIDNKVTFLLSKVLNRKERLDCGQKILKANSKTNTSDEFRDLLVETKKQAKSQEDLNYYIQYMLFYPYMQFTPPMPPASSTKSLEPHMNHIEGNQTKEQRGKGGRQIGQSIEVVEKFMNQQQHIEFGQKQGSETLQIDNRLGKIVKEEIGMFGKIRYSRRSEHIESLHGSFTRSITSFLGTKTGTKMLPFSDKFEETK